MSAVIVWTPLHLTFKHIPKNQERDHLALSEALRMSSSRLSTFPTNACYKKSAYLYSHEIIINDDTCGYKAPVSSFIARIGGRSIAVGSMLEGRISPEQASMVVEVAHREIRHMLDIVQEIRSSVGYPSSEGHKVINQFLGFNDRPDRNFAESPTGRLGDVIDSESFCSAQREGHDINRL